MKNQFISYNQAKKIVQQNNIKNLRMFNEWKKQNKVKNIPRNPYKIYQNHWVSWYEFLGTKKISYKGIHMGDFISFDAAKKFLKKFHLKGKKDWREFCKSGKKPMTIPSDPYGVYKDKGWTTWYDFLGYKPRRSDHFISYIDAKKILKKIGVKNALHFRRLRKEGVIPMTIPSDPQGYFSRRKNERKI